MPDDDRKVQMEQELEKRHEHAETLIAPYRFARPDSSNILTKASVGLARGEIMRGYVQVLKKDGGENNLHYHTNAETFWWVIKGRVRFYGKDDVVLGEFGPNEGIITPRFSRYWFENCGDEELELLQVAASDQLGHKDGRINAAPRHEHQDKMLLLDEQGNKTEKYK